MAITSAKFLGRSSSSNTLSATSVENLSVVASKLIDVDTLLKGSLLLDEMRAKNKRKADQQKKRDEKESAREKLGKMGKGIKDKAVSATAGMRDWLNRLVMGALLILLLNWHQF